MRELCRLVDAVKAWLALHERRKGVEEGEVVKTYRELLDALTAAKGRIARGGRLVGN